MFINYTIRFLLHKRSDVASQDYTIRMRVSVRGIPRIEISTPHKVNEDNWDADRECAVRGSKGAVAINRTIDEWRSTMAEVLARFELIEKRMPSAPEIKNLFFDLIGRETDIKKELPSEFRTSNEIIDKFMSSQGLVNQWSKGTYVKFNSIKKMLNRFNPNLVMPMFTQDMMMRLMKMMEDEGYHNSTIDKNISCIRWFLRWAANNGYYTGDVHINFRPRVKGVSVDSREIIYCTIDEIKKIESATFSEANSYLNSVRDVFLFGCYTGLRYSDIAKLKKEDVKDGYIRVVTQKTNDALKIELNKHSQAILDKYKDVPLKDDAALPTSWNQVMNRALKHLGLLCGLDSPTKVISYQGADKTEETKPKWMLMTTHVARRTFVITALQLGIPSEVIMKWTGHSDFKSMKPYVKIVDDLKAKSMAKFDLL